MGRFLCCGLELFSTSESSVRVWLMLIMDAFLSKNAIRSRVEDL